MNTNTRDLGIGSGPGKGDASRITDIVTYRENYDAIAFVKSRRVRSNCCEAPFVVVGNVTKHYECLCCRNACDVATYEIT